MISPVTENSSLARGEGVGASMKGRMRLGHGAGKSPVALVPFNPVNPHQLILG